MTIMLKATLNLLLAGLLFLALTACGAEDGDLIPPSVTYDEATVLPANRPLAAPDRLLPTDTVRLVGTMSDDATLSAEVSTSAPAVLTTVPGSPTGTWSCDVTGLVEGENIVYVTATDPVGNNQLLQIPIVVDLTGPLMTIDQYTTPLPPGTQTVAGTVSELGSGVSVDVLDSSMVTVISGVAATVDATVWSADLNLALGDDVYTVVATGTDPLGNTTVTPATQVISVDSVTPAPVLTVATPALPVISASTLLPFNGTVDPACTLLLNGVPVTVAAGSWSADIGGLTAGLHVSILDACSGGSVLRALIYTDLDPPQVLTADRLLPVGATTVTIDFGEDMDPAVANVNLSLLDSDDAPLIIQSASSTARSFTFTLAAGLPAGIYTATLASFDTAQLADARGNLLAFPYSWKIKVKP